MKKFVAFITILLAFSMGMQAQTSGTTYVLPAGVTSYTAFNYATHTATCIKDTIGGTATKYWIFDLAKPTLNYYQLVVEYDTSLAYSLTTARTVGNHVTVTTYGSIDKSYWVKLDTVLFHPTTMWLPAAQQAGTTPAVASLADVSTGVLWRYIKVSCTGSDAGKAAVITRLMIKIGQRY